MFSRSNDFFIVLALVLPFAAFSNDCSPLFPNCLSCSASPFQCTSCPDNLTCCQSTCSECSPQSQCLGCTAGYTLNSTSSLCVLSDSCSQQACTACNNSGTLSFCQQCMSGYRLISATHECLPCPVQCQVCDDNLKCIECQISFSMELLPPGICQNCSNIITSTLNCLSCNLKTCLKCKPGYYLYLADCHKCPNGCAECVSKSSCSVCSPGFFLNSSQLCKPCASTCTNCFGSSTNCTSCPIDSFLQNGLCQSCFSQVPFCSSCVAAPPNSQLPIVCLSCSIGLFSFQGAKCMPCPQFCTSCINQTYCTACQQVAFLNSSSSLCQSCGIQNCNFCVQNSTSTNPNAIACYSCFNGFNQNSNSSQCIQCHSSCQECYTNGNCNGCYGYQFLFQGSCIPCQPNCQLCSISPGNCNFCLPTFFAIQLSSQKKVCLPCPIFCLECMFVDSRNSLGCLLCQPGNFLTNKTCIPCSDPNCFNCSSSLSVCSSCQSGFYLNPTTPNASCTPCPTGCSICSSSLSLNTCQQCQNGYILANNSQCQQCLNNCLFCLSAASCQQCQSSFYPVSIANSTLCVKCAQGCLECQSAVICTVCQSGYFLSTSSSSLFSSLSSTTQSCLKCSPPCASCSGQNGSICTSCSPAFAFQLFPNGSLLCSACPANCLRCVGNYHFSGLQCLECSQGYFISVSFSSNLTIPSSSCSACPPDCLSCRSVHSIYRLPSLQQSNGSEASKCVQCQQGLTLLQNGQCFKCGSTNETSGCAECNSNGQCSKCFPLFTLTSNGTCSNNNFAEAPSDWPLIGSCIGLGCLAMVLIIILLFRKLVKPTRPSSRHIELGTGDKF